MAAENAELRRRLRDMVTLLGMPAVWAGREVAGVAEVAADVLLSAAHADGVLVRCRSSGTGGQMVEAASGRDGSLDGDARARLAAAIGATAADAPTLAVHDGGEGGGGGATTVVLRVGTPAAGAIAATSRRPGFPDEFERLLLTSAANQLAVALKERYLAQERAHVLETVNRVGRALTAELDMQRLVQALTDAARELSGAEFGAFFYNVHDDHGGSYRLFALSGASPEAFAGFPMPRNTAVFGPTFEGRGPVRWDDVRRAPGYGRNPPYEGLPPGHLPVVSYLAVPVVSRSGEVLGGLFFGHSQPAIFTQREEQLVAGVAAQAAIAMDNARLFEQAQRFYREAQEASRLKDEFLATLSHELRTPLNAIVGWVHLMRSGSLDEAGRARAVDVIARNAAAQNRLIADMLDLTRIVAGRLRLDVTPVEMHGVLTAVVDSMRPAADAKGVTLTIDAEAGEVAGDASRLQQIVWNLVSNAVKFTPAGGTVEVKLRRAGARIEVSVTDTGAGLDAALMPRLFEPFRQGDSSSTRRHGGLGLGLSIVKRLAELHGGTVRASSAGTGCGSTFTVSLPYREPSVEATPALRPPAPAAASAELGEASLDGVRVLVVEDEADARELVATALEMAGATVVTAGSAAAAIDALLQQPPDVLVSDIEMPEVDGYGLMRRIRALPGTHAALPCVALTAYAGSQDRVRALEAGFHLHIAKPVDPGELVGSVGRLVQASRAGALGPGGDAPG